MFSQIFRQIRWQEFFPRFGFRLTFSAASARRANVVRSFFREHPQRPTSFTGKSAHLWHFTRQNIFKFEWRFHEFSLSRNFRAKLFQNLARSVFTDFSSAEISAPNYFQSFGCPLAYIHRIFKIFLK